MNYFLFFLIISLAIIGFSVITLSSAPLINNKEIQSTVYENCQYYADMEELSRDLNERYSYRRKKTLCERRKAMHGLEYGSFIFDIVFGFFCGLLSFLQYLNIGKDFKKNTGLIGLITGIIGFILTFIYFIYSAYIFTNDVNEDVYKLYPNGAIKKLVNGNYITIYEGDTKDDSQYAKYNELGQKQYNYDSDYYKLYDSDDHCIESSTNKAGCEYIYARPKYDFKNKYKYDRWTTTLIFAFLISVCNLGLALFGLLIFFQKGEETK